MVSVASSNGFIQTVNGTAPCEGTRALPLILDFSVTNAYLADFTQQYNQGQFTTIQTVYIDNLTGVSVLEVVCDSTGQIIACPAKSQGYFPVLEGVPPKFIIQTSDTQIHEVIFLNFYIPPDVWTVPVTNSAGLPEVDVPALDAVIVGGKVQVNSVPPTLSALTDASGTIAVGGTAQQVFAANITRERFTIANPDTATETLYMSWGTGAAGQIPLQPGMIWDESGSTVVGEAIFLNAATTGHAFTAYAE